MEMRKRHGIGCGLAAFCTIVVAGCGLLKPPAERATDRGVAKLEEGDYAGAAAAFTEAIRLKPDEARNYVRRAYARAESFDYAGAIADCTVALKLDPQCADAYAIRAGGRRDSGDVVGALKDYDEALRLDPEDAWTVACRARARLDKGDEAGALADFSRAIELDPKEPSGYAVRGVAYLEMGKLDLALADLDQAVTLDPDDAAAYSERGQVHWCRREWAKALADFRAAYERDKAWAALWVWLARCRLGERQAATAELREALALGSVGGRPEHMAKQPWIVRIASFLVGDVSEAALLAAAATDDKWESRGRLCEAHFYIGMRRLIGGDKAKALASLRKAAATGARERSEFTIAQIEIKTRGD
jgi:lipoprotein NlpI